jgi:hypothetical protein
MLDIEYVCECRLTGASQMAAVGRSVVATFSSATSAAGNRPRLEYSRLFGHGDYVFGLRMPVIKKVKADKNFAFVLRHFPLALHPNAQLAAEASECAAEQGRFWDYSSALFENGNSLSDAAFEAIAATVGLDMVNFSACLKDHKYAAVVDADRDDGDHMRIRGTPVTYINGRRVEGAFSESLLKSKLARGGP